MLSGIALCHWIRNQSSGKTSGKNHVRHAHDLPQRCAQQGSVIRFIYVEFHRSASKHGVENDDVLHAISRAFVVADMGDDNTPLRTLILGPDRAGNMLEVIVLHFDDGREMAIHAMAMRSRYNGLLRRRLET